MDNPELKPGAAQPPAVAPAKAKQPINPQISEEPLFFNVMPKSGHRGGMTQPSLTTETPKVSAPKTDAADFLKKYKWYAVIAAAILVGGPLIYFLINKIGSSSYQTENLLVQRPAGSLSPSKPSATSTTPSATSTPALGASGADFTTPRAWLDKYFPNCTDPSLCGDNADPDHDGLINLKEYELGTDPNNPDSDQDGLSDGDEVNVFGTDPLNSHTANDPKYNDADYFKGGYDIGTGKNMSAAHIAAISAKMKTFGLHEPTITTLSNVLNSIYNFSTGTTTAGSTASSTPSTSASSSAVSGLDESVEAKQGRDTQRSNTVLNLEVALVAYEGDNKSYPITNDFGTMYDEVKPYLKVATNPTDPINTGQYVYTYTSQPDGSDFDLSFFSEVAGQVITKNAPDAIKDASTEKASIYDNQRESDLESLRTALLLYSQNNVGGTQTYAFPTVAKYKTAIVPEYIEQIPKDPETGADYQYQVSATFDTFTLKAVLDNPPTGTTGYSCNQDGCQNY